jgi:AcrR family transcriptional regulator
MSYRRSPQMEERLADNRERIVKATRRLIAQGGFREAQMSAVAAAAGLSTGAIYRYFPSKAELFIEVMSAAVRVELEILADIGRAAQPAAVRLTKSVESFARRALAGRNLAYAFIAEPVDPEVDTARIRYRRDLSRAIESLLIEGVKRGEFPRQDTEVSAACIVGAFTEALVGPTGPSGSATTQEDRDRIIKGIGLFCLRAVNTKNKRGHP